MGSAVLTAVAVTIISFLPVFTMIGMKASCSNHWRFTKTFALAASVIVALTIIPPVAHVLFTTRVKTRTLQQALHGGLVVAGIVIAIRVAWWAGIILAALGVYRLVEESLPARHGDWRIGCASPGLVLANGAAVLLVGILLTGHWLPLGPEKGLLRNFIFVARLIGGLLLLPDLRQVPLRTDSVVVLESQGPVSDAAGIDSALGLRRWVGPAFFLGPPQAYQSQSRGEQETPSLLDQFKHDLAGVKSRAWEGDVAKRR